MRFATTDSEAGHGRHELLVLAAPRPLSRPWSHPEKLKNNEI